MQPFRPDRPRLLPGRTTRVICWRDCDDMCWASSEWLVKVGDKRLARGRNTPKQNHYLQCKMLKIQHILYVTICICDAWDLAAVRRRQKSLTAAYSWRTNWPHDFARSSPHNKGWMLPPKSKDRLLQVEVWCQFSGVSEFFHCFEKRRVCQKSLFKKGS